MKDEHGRYELKQQASVNENRPLDDKNSPGLATMARPGHYEEMGKDHSSSSPPWEQADAHGVSERHLRQMWEDAGQIKHSAHYQDLLGPPTMRERVVALWRRAKGGISGDHRHEGKVASYRQLWVGAAAMGALAVIGSTWVIWPAGPDYETQTAQVQDIALNDGSIVTLGAQSALDVDFTDETRTVRLASGEAFFAISKDRQRPFVVLAGDKHIRVVGTRFNVNYDGRRVHVAVKEGIVDVMQPVTGTMSGEGRAGPITQKIRLVAGQQLTLSKGGILGQPQSLAGARPGSWREGRLNYQDALLSDIIADAGRYYPHDIRIASPSLAQERLTTSFRTSQVDAMLNSLPQILPVEAVHLPDGTVELRRKDMPTAR